MATPSPTFLAFMHVKSAAELSPEVLGALLGAGGGGLIQGVRKLMQSRRDEEENGSPSILAGMLGGGLLGGGLGAGYRYLGAPASPAGYRYLGAPASPAGTTVAGAPASAAVAALRPQAPGTLQQAPGLPRAAQLVPPVEQAAPRLPITPPLGVSGLQVSGLQPESPGTLVGSTAQALRPALPQLGAVPPALQGAPSTSFSGIMQQMRKAKLMQELQATQRQAGGANRLAGYLTSPFQQAGADIRGVNDMLYSGVRDTIDGAAALPGRAYDRVYNDLYGDLQGLSQLGGRAYDAGAGALNSVYDGTAGALSNAIEGAAQKLGPAPSLPAYAPPPQGDVLGGYTGTLQQPLGLR